MSDTIPASEAVDAARLVSAQDAPLLYRLMIEALVAEKWRLQEAARALNDGYGSQQDRANRARDFVRTVVDLYGSALFCGVHDDCHVFIGDDDYPLDEGPICPLCDPEGAAAYLRWCKGFRS